MLREKKNSVTTKQNKPRKIYDYCDYCTADEIMFARHTIPPTHTLSLSLIYFPELLHLGHGDRAALTEGD